MATLTLRPNAAGTYQQFTIYPAPIIRVQGNARGTILTGTDLTVTMGSTPTDGNVLVATIVCNSDVTPRTITSVTQTNVAWTEQKYLSSVLGGNAYMYAIWLGVVSAGAGTGITIVFSGEGANYGAIGNVCEYSGILTVNYLDKTASDSGSGVATSTGTTANTTQASELWIGVTGADNESQATPTNGFTLLDGVKINYISNAYLEKIVAATGAANSGTTIASQYWGGCIATFKASTSPTHYGVTSDQSDTTGVQVSASTTLKETENLADHTAESGTINNVTAYSRAKYVTGSGSIVYVGATNTGANNPTSGNWSLPAGWAANDLGIFWWYGRVNTKTMTLDDAKVTAKAGFPASSAGYGYIFVGYRVLQAGDSTMGWTSANISNADVAYGVSVFRGANITGDPFKAQSGAPATFADTQSPNPAAVTTVAVYDVAFTIFGKNNDYAASIAPPSGYALCGSAQSTAGTDGSAGCAYKEVAAVGSEDPAAWTLGGASTDDGYIWTACISALASNSFVFITRTVGTDYESASPIALTASFAEYSEVRTVNPNTSAEWTWAQVDALELGSRTPTKAVIQWSEYWVIVDYTPPGGVAVPVFLHHYVQLHNL